jgi:hypothetical protein
MPTAARLVSAFMLAIVAWVLSELVRPLMPEGTGFGYFNYVNTFIGVCVGWTVMGSRAGRGFVQGINNGVTGVVVLILWGLAVHSSAEMFRLAVRNRYDGAMEALTAIFLIGSEYGLMIATSSIIVTSIVAALIVGPVADLVAKRWS